MIDFTKKLAAKKLAAVIDPCDLYEKLDRASDKGPLRPTQTAVLREWFTSRRDCRDVVVKLHTGQGKTLIGLLMLQSRLNEKTGPCVYLCPNNFLIAQTCRQAEQFGIPTCTASSDLPDDFIDGKTILVTSIQKLFNGMTKFGLDRKSVDVGTLLMDDAHACSDAIRTACRIRVPKGEPAYAAILTLFAAELEGQGVGTYADIENGGYDALLPVPYWAWMERESEVAGVLSSNSDRGSIKYTWPLLKNMLRHCRCMVSGGAIEIEPIIPPLERFGTYWKAKRRVFMSATVTDDAFLVKGLRLAPKTILEPLTFESEGWSGEKMVLLPSLIDDSLTRMEVVHMFARPKKGRGYGIVGLVPSFKSTTDWKSYGAQIAETATIDSLVGQLTDEGSFDETVVLVNRYDGIDLPDRACRILVFDTKPYSESLVDLHSEACRPDSETTLVRMVRTIEQGFGRSVRGEKDYCVIVVTGPRLTRLIRAQSSRSYFSSQMNAQIDIGLSLAKFAQEEIEGGLEPKKALRSLIRQCLQRDEGWKAFYAEKMAVVTASVPNANLLEIYHHELDAEEKYLKGDYGAAADSLQALLDIGITNPEDKGWYLQQIARYYWKSKRAESQALQNTAFMSNRLLLKPAEGVTVTQLRTISHGRMERIARWITAQGDYLGLDATVSDILSRLVFGVKAESFEHALNELSFALGFKGERPDKEWKEGPDNLWAIDDHTYIVWECKSEVDINRAEVHKREAEQMNRSCAWFGKHYPGVQSTNIMIIPTHTVQSAAGFTHEVHIAKETDLRRLMKNVRSFFKSFEGSNFASLSVERIQSLVDNHELSEADVVAKYCRTPRHRYRDRD